MNYNTYTFSDIGNRYINENSFLCDTFNNLFVLAEGMGGKGYGDYASKTVVKNVSEYMNHLTQDSEATMIIQPKAGVSTDLLYLESSVNYCNRELIKVTKKDKRYPFACASVLALITKNRYFSIVNIGACSAYMFCNNNLKKLTKGITVNSVPYFFTGYKDQIEILSLEEQYQLPCSVILMTSSVSSVLTEQDISLIIKEKDANAEHTAKELGLKSRKLGNIDNCTVMVINIDK